MKELLLLVVLILHSAGAIAQTRTSGHIVTKDGNTIWADEIETLGKGVWNVNLIHEGQTIKSKSQCYC